MWRQIFKIVLFLTLLISVYTLYRLFYVVLQDFENLYEKFIKNMKDVNHCIIDLFSQCSHGPTGEQ